MSDSKYSTPQVRFLGTVAEMTKQDELDKIGSATDAASQVVPGLDGTIQPDA